jgi:hypothetical protein
MSRTPSTFRSRDLTRAVKAVVAAGVDVARVEIDTAGKIVIVTSKTSRIAETPMNDLDRELEQWEARHGQD